MIRLLSKTLAVDTLQQTGERFTIDGVVSFNVMNVGTYDAVIMYENGSARMSIPKGTQRSFGGHSGFIYKGVMKVEFVGSNYGSIEVAKDVVDTNELK